METKRGSSEMEKTLQINESSKEKPISGGAYASGYRSASSPKITTTDNKDMNLTSKMMGLNIKTADPPFSSKKQRSFPGPGKNTKYLSRITTGPTLPLQNYRPRCISTLFTWNSEHRFIDCHCHLDFLFRREEFLGTYADYISINQDTFPYTYEGCIAVFCDPHTFHKRDMWQKFLNEENVWGTFGCHPKNAAVYCNSIELNLCMASNDSRVCALGEIGLDYSKGSFCRRNIQKTVFHRQLRIALRKNLPLVIHCRDANEDCMQIMQEVLPKDYKIHLHCFSGTWEWASKWLLAFPNLYIGITNLVTFPSALSTHEVARRIPLHRLLLETDAPYFVPTSYRGHKRFSHPGMAIHVAAQVAALKKLSVGEVIIHTRRNTKFVYGI